MLPSVLSEYWRKEFETEKSKVFCWVVGRKPRKELRNEGKCAGNIANIAD